jgi:serine/threonine-protein kinase
MRSTSAPSRELPIPLTSPVFDGLVGTTIGARYRVTAVLGSGGMCSVYRAIDRRDGTAVALKILSAESAADPRAVARFKREVVSCRRIQHANVVRISDSGELDCGSQYLVMELLDGRDLATVLDGGPIGIARALDLARQMLRGLEAAHAIGIVHRDIKPENIMLTRERDREIVKLVDFGIASNDRAAIKLTTAGIAFGTAEYMSPEMAMGLPVDARADLYAVGVVLFEMVTGRLPFVAEDLKQLLHAHVEEPPPSPRSVAPGARIPHELEEIILRAVAKLPEQRFPTAAAMADALAAVPPPRTSRRRPALLVSVLIVALLSLAVAQWWNHRTVPPLPLQQTDVTAAKPIGATTASPHKPRAKKRHR